MKEECITQESCSQDTYTSHARQHVMGVHRKTQSCSSNALRSFLWAFSLSFGLRAGISLMLRCFKLATKDPRLLLDLNKLLGEDNFKIRVEAVRLGLFTGVFSGLFNYFMCLFERIRNGHYPLNTFLAGSIAGISVLFLPKESQRTFALYMMARLVQCLYNEAKRREWISPLPCGDSLLFILTSAQIMYAYVMRPGTLPASYWKFIVRMGPIDGRVLEAVKNNNRGVPIDLNKINSYITNTATKAGVEPRLLKTATPSIIGCNVLHPMNSSCQSNASSVFLSAFKKAFPIYASLTFAPMLLLKLFKVFRSPISYLGKGMFQAIRSSMFLALFPTIYQGVVCAHRNAMTTDFRFVYWFAGIFGAGSIFLETKRRHSELALYTLPRAADSLFKQLHDRRWMFSIPRGEIGLFMAAMGGLMYFFHDHAHQTMAPLLSSLFRWYLSRQDRCLLEKERQEKELKEKEEKTNQSSLVASGASQSAFVCFDSTSHPSSPNPEDMDACTSPYTSMASSPLSTVTSEITPPF